MAPLVGENEGNPN